ncbi:MAG: glycoside hydrolase family 32 protein [Clostridia bacterium]|nr:glycoside hydrolase family 32 protein [Clostridia bacterium]
MLNKANQQQLKAVRSDRPLYHFSVPVGWLNDPNGLSFRDGKVHLFYQYYPYGPYWSYMHWGHAVSRDLTFWEDLPVALAPDMPYDAAGCFSGSAVNTDRGHALIYTGVSGELDEDGLPHGPQQQCLAFGDGITYAKSDQNPVIPSPQLPDGFLPQDFRDPKVWLEDGTYRMVVAATRPDGLGRVLAFESPDLISWERRGVLLENDGSFGTMWECPDLFMLDGTDVALVSVIAMPPGRDGIHPGNPVLAFTGAADFSLPGFTAGSIQQVDEGTDFYAPQTMVMPDGRRIMIAWMQNGFNRIAPPDQDWQGMMTYPRELSLEEGRLVQNPAREIESSWSDAVHLDDIVIEGEKELPGISGRALDLKIELRELQGALRITFAAGPASGVTLAFDPGSSCMTFDRTRAGGGSVSDALPVQSFRVPEGVRSLRILVDRNSLEVFINDGHRTFTGIFYAPNDADGIIFSADGRARLAVEKHAVTAPAV